MNYGETMSEHDQLSGDSHRGANSASRRFRLPKLFAESDAVSLEESSDIRSAEVAVEVSSDNGALEAMHPDETGDPAPEHLAMLERAAGVMMANGGSGGATKLQELRQLQRNVEEISCALRELNERESAQDKVFSALYDELQGYKNDFIYERLKPMVRSLLFLFDSLEQFDAELAQRELDERATEEHRQAVSPDTVRHNIAFFRDQLVEALHICEVTPMEKPEGQFDPRLHKAIEIIQVSTDQDNVVQRVVRSGWYLNGHVFRPAEVIVGKKAQDYDAKVWNYGKGNE
jgi:molecular chaperone GrpE (heat shock protein)